MGQGSGTSLSALVTQRSDSCQTVSARLARSGRSGTSESVEVKINASTSLALFEPSGHAAHTSTRMSAPPGPSRPPQPRASSDNGPTSSTASPFSANAARATPPNGQSSVARGKQPAQAGAVTPGAAAGAGGRVVQPGGGTPQPGAAGGAVSVGGPGGIVRRTTLNSVLVNTRQVRSRLPPSPSPALLRNPVRSCSLLCTYRRAIRSLSTFAPCRGSSAT